MAKIKIRTDLTFTADLSNNQIITQDNVACSRFKEFKAELALRFIIVDHTPTRIQVTSRNPQCGAVYESDKLEKLINEYLGK